MIFGLIHCLMHTDMLLGNTMSVGETLKEIGPVSTRENDRCAMTNKHGDSLVPPLISPHDNNFKFTEIAETWSQDGRNILHQRVCTVAEAHLCCCQSWDPTDKNLLPFSSRQHFPLLSRKPFFHLPHLFQCLALAYLESSVLPYWPSLDFEVINSTVRGRGKNLINTMTKLTSVKNLAQIYKGSGC